MSQPRPMPRSASIDLAQTDPAQSRVGKPMDRCCESHPDWPTLTHHLIDGYPAVALEDIVRAVAEAKTATDGMDLSGADALVTGEVLARQQLHERSASQAGDAGSHASGSAPTP